MESSVKESQCPVDLKHLVVIAKQFRDNPALEFLRGPEDDLQLEPILKGDVNFNFRCSSKKTSKDEVFIKYAAAYCKNVPHMKLSVDRLATEYYSMLYCYEASAQSVAKPLCFSREQNIAMFEFLRGYEDYEAVVVRGQVNQQTVTSLAESLGKLHNSTHVNTLSIEKFAELKNQVNCPDVAENSGNFYFHDGYYDETALQQVKPQHKTMREEFLKDSVVQSGLAQAKQYLSEEECLIHNDLHFNSIMVKDNVPKMIDFEFALVGNPARDVGIVLSMFIAMYYYHLVCPENNDQHRQMAYKMLDACKWFTQTYYEQMTVYGADLDRRKREMAPHISSVVGSELASRVLSTPHIPSIQDSKHVAEVETEMLGCAIRLLKKQQSIDSVDKMLFIGLMLC